MEEAYKEGKVKAIGICNFYPERLTDLCLNAEVIPAVNQIELRPFFQQKKVLAVMKEFGIQPEAWGPLAEGKNGILSIPTICDTFRDQVPVSDTTLYSYVGSGLLEARNLDLRRKVSRPGSEFTDPVKIETESERVEPL